MMHTHAHAHDISFRSRRDRIRSIQQTAVGYRSTIVYICAARLPGLDTEEYLFALVLHSFFGKFASKSVSVLVLL